MSKDISISIASQLQSGIFEILQNSQLFTSLEKQSVSLEHPANESHGDFSTNLALVLFGKQGINEASAWKNPRELAQAIVKLLEDTSHSQFPYLEKIDVAGPGFINFTLSIAWLKNQLLTITRQKSSYGKSDVFNGKKVSVEYTDPNPFKEFHIGHLYSNIVGESLATLHESMGAEVWRADFFGDVGMHVAKSIWGILNKFEEESLSLQEIAEWGLAQRIEYFGQAYAKGSTAYKEDSEAKQEMEALNFLIFKAAQEVILPQYQKTPEINFDAYVQPSKYHYEEIKSLYVTGRKWSLEYFESIYQRLGTHFDGYYPESLTGEYGYQLVQEGLKNGHFEKGKRGAVIFPGEKHGLHNRVFINALGLPTYETKDLGLAKAKYADFKYDLSYNVTGNEINDYFQVVLTALKKVLPDLGNKTIHVGHGMVRLPEGKMSSRTGNILRGEWLLDEAKSAAVKILKENNRESELTDDALAEQIALGAIKYALLKQNIGEDIAFDFKKSISFSGNSGPYLQYTYARATSILRKAQPLSSSDSQDFENEKHAVQPNNEEMKLLKWLYQYPEVLTNATLQYSPHLVCTYLYELAQRFNSFYNKHSVLEESPSKQFRLLLTEAVSVVIQNGLSMLGIKAPEKM